MARVICIGELLWDYVAQETGVAYNAVEHWTSHLGGAPANVACGLQQLGLSTALISCVGADTTGQGLLDACQTHGIEVTGIQQQSQWPTRQVHILRNHQGDRSIAGFGPQAATDFADRHLQAAQIPVSLFETAEYLVFGTLAWAAPESRPALTRALELADQFQLKVFLDVNWRPLFWDNPETALALMGQLWPRIDFLKLSAEEVQFLFNTTEAAAIAQTIDSLEGVWITNGGEGPISYYLSGHTGQINPFPVAAVDTTGAGDSFVAGLIAQLSQHGLAATSQDAKLASHLTTYAAAVGALSTLKMGAIAAQPTPAQVEQFLSQYTP